MDDIDISVNHGKGKIMWYDQKPIMEECREMKLKAVGRWE